MSSETEGHEAGCVAANGYEFPDEVVETPETDLNAVFTGESIQ